MERGELERVVARAIADNCWRVVDASDGHPSIVEDPERAAVAAIGVVLAEATRAVEARRAAIARVYDGGAYAIGADDALGEALAVLSGLVPLPPV